MFDSSAYGLSNAAFTEDVGLSNMDKTMPMAPACLGGNYIPDVTGAMAGITMQGSLTCDKVELTQKEKDKKAFKTFFKIGAVIAAGVLGVKYGKKVLRTCLDGTKSLVGKIKPKKT